MRYAFIQASFEDSELKDIPIAKRCEVLEVSVSGYHAWVKRQRMPVKCKKVISDETVLKQAKIIRNEMKYTPGYRQMHALMRQRGVCIGVKRLRGVLRVNGIIGYRISNVLSKRPTAITTCLSIPTSEGAILLPEHSTEHG